MAIKTRTLFHFTQRLDTLIKIIDSGFWPRCCREDFSWLLGPLKELAFPMVCFCDIPLSQIQEHTDTYGQYGIGVSKEWGKSNGLNPLVYLDDESTLTKGIKASILQLLDHYVANGDSDDESKSFFRLLMNLKPTVGYTNRSGTFETKDFYEECEWRHIPFEVDDLLLENFSEEDIEEINKITEARKLSIPHDEIRYVFVRKESEIPDVCDALTSRYKSETPQALKILCSKIVSLDELSKDY